MNNNTTTISTNVTAHMNSPLSPSITIQVINILDDWLAGPTDPGLGKPAGTAADMCHEYPLPIGSPRMALDDSTQTPMLRWKGYVKDDVFFAQAPADPFFLEDDIASLSSHASSTTELVQRSVEGTPSDLLYDHEPLFDGIEEDHLNEKQDHVVRTEPIRRNSTVSTDLDWSALLDELSDDEEETLKRKRPEDEEDDVVEERICQLHLSDSSEEEEPIKTNRRIKRRKKSILPCKKQPKKKSVTPPVVIEQAQDGLTLFENLTQAGIDWCRYCGTTEGVNWRPGPWGKRTLCK
ncbi:hypothetical protein EC973_009177 [Apophysomyces ossiformis]|uniref:GATA-type domain-containing protein n=1 Tax=Apophysomyces ossiformis TaxID=679940 RepID=A0A8H7BPG4_9FUNG|nr:hypothetical protein EC973_009177 [Apophysomyces ossiformis]